MLWAVPGPSQAWRCVWRLQRFISEGLSTSKTCLSAVLAAAAVSLPVLGALGCLADRDGTVGSDRELVS